MAVSKKIILGVFIIFCYSIFSQDALATSGTCSDHGGVNCAAGPDWDRSAICNDGWRDSSEAWAFTKECFDDYVSKVDIDTELEFNGWCWREHGPNSYFNKDRQTCSCTKGYLQDIKDWKCIPDFVWCPVYIKNSIGHDGTCTCNYGYLMDKESECLPISPSPIPLEFDTPAIPITTPNTTITPTQTTTDNALPSRFDKYKLKVARPTPTKLSIPKPSITTLPQSSMGTASISASVDNQPFKQAVRQSKLMNLIISIFRKFKFL